MRGMGAVRGFFLFLKTCILGIKHGFGELQQNDIGYFFPLYHKVKAVKKNAPASLGGLKPGHENFTS